MLQLRMRYVLCTVLSSLFSIGLSQVFTSTIDNQSSKTFHVYTFPLSSSGIKKSNLLKPHQKKSYKFLLNSFVSSSAVVKLQITPGNRNGTIFFISLKDKAEIRGCNELGLICQAQVQPNHNTFTIQKKQS